jgi:hypothetical protein
MLVGGRPDPGSAPRSEGTRRASCGGLVLFGERMDMSELRAPSTIVGGLTDFAAS